MKPYCYFAGCELKAIDQYYNKGDPIYLCRAHFLIAPVLSEIPLKEVHHGKGLIRRMINFIRG